MRTREERNRDKDMKPKLVVFVAVTALLLAYGTYQALVVAPTEATMGDVQRIFYYHVPNAWSGGMMLFINFAASVWYLITRKAVADALAVAAAEVGLVFATIVLVTGPIWARPVWGIWWTWDARITSTLVLWLIYLSYLILRRFATGGQVRVLAAVLAIFAFADVPFVYFAIIYFRTQHPSPVFGGGGSVAPSIAHPFLWNLVAFSVYSFLLLHLRFTHERKRQYFEESLAASFSA